MGYGVTLVVSNVPLLDAVKPAGALTDTVADPGPAGVNCASAVLEPPVKATGEAMPPTPGLLLLKDTCTEASPPRNAWVTPE